MVDGPLLTADAFINERFDWGDRGQWSELVQGRPLLLEPPDVEHGNVVLMLSKRLSEFVARHPTYAARFGVGLRTTRKPDSIRFPAIAVFSDVSPFFESDADFTDQAPSIIFDVCSTPDRRKHLERRVEEFFNLGVERVWIAFPSMKEVHGIDPTEMQPLDQEREFVEPAMPGLRFPIAELFKPPKWW